MICNKCGHNIEETDKFCGFCGNRLEVKSEEKLNIHQQETNEDLGTTIRIEPIAIVSETVTNEHQEMQVSDELNKEGSSEQSNEAINQPSAQSSTTKKTKSNKLIIIILGIALAIVAVGIVIFAVMKSSNNSVAVLEKAINNLYNNGASNSTVNTILTFGTETGEALSFSLTVKTEAESKDIYKTQITLNKSLLFEEMNAYIRSTKEEAVAYFESSLVDLLGTTSSLEPIWLHYNIPLTEIEDILPKENQEFSLNEILDEEHFKYVDKSGDLTHYVLTIDQKIINTIKAKSSEYSNEELNDKIESMEELKGAVKIEVYITDSNELSRAELNLSNFLQDVEGVSELIMIMEFKNIGSTYINIPSDALSSEVDIQTYLITNSVDEVIEGETEEAKTYGDEYNNVEFDF